jgi:pyruvate formate lyase activating enzyme
MNGAAGTGGLILRFERASIHDGEGLRTVVFLKGCPLRCKWCSTPESQRACIERFGDTVYGRQVSVEETLHEIRKDTAFFFHSHGGVTISGGEPLAQADFVTELLRGACKEGIHTAMESSLYGPFSDLSKTLPYLDTLLADIKHMDNDRHRELCGVENADILSNIQSVSAMKADVKLVVRVPVIPGINDDAGHLIRLGEFCADLKRLQYVQLLPYHRLGTATYRKMNREYALPHILPPSGEHMETCRAIVRKYVRVV